MDKMKTVIAAAIVAVGIVVLGFCIKAGLGSFLQNQRVVTVKGLAVREVKANMRVIMYSYIIGEFVEMTP